MIARRLAPLALALTLMACGSRPDSELPRPAEGAGGSATIRGEPATLDPQRRLLELGGERADAGLGPYGVTSDGDNYLYVTDRDLDAVLVFRARPELRLIRRLALPGGPGPIRYDHDRNRIFVMLTETGETAELRTGARIAVLSRDK